MKVDQHLLQITLDVSAILYEKVNVIHSSVPECGPLGSAAGSTRQESSSGLANLKIVEDWKILEILLCMRILIAGKPGIVILS